MSTQHKTELSDQAYSHLANGDLQGARSLYERFIAAFPDDVHGHTMLGAVRLELGDPTGALACLRKALELDPNDADAHFHMGILHRHASQIEEARRHFELAANLDPGHADAWLALAGCQGALGDTRQAETSARTALALTPDIENGWLVLGHALGIQKKHAEALACYARARATQPHNPQLLAGIGACQQALGQLDAAKTSFEQSMRIAPDVAASHLALASVLLDLKQIDAANEAVLHLNRAAELDPSLTAVHAALGRAYSALGNLAGANAAYRQAIQAEPAESSHPTRLGAIQHALGQFQPAADSFRTALAHDPANVDAHLGLGGALQALGNLEASLTHFRRAIELRPGDAEVHFALATSLLHDGRAADAVESFERALQCDPKRADAYVGIAAAHMIHSDVALAQAAIESAFRIDPEYKDAITLSASFAERAGDVEGAYRQLSRIIGRHGGDPNVALSYAAVCKETGRHEEAIALLESLLANRQTNTASNRRNLHFALGKLYDSNKQWDKAFAHYAAGNALKDARFDSGRHILELEALKRIFSAEFMARAPRASIRSDRPVFVVGMPRSGTTLVEQVLASHPQVHGAGELTDMIQAVSTLHATVGSDLRYPQCVPALTTQHLDLLAKNYLDKLEALAPHAVRVVDKMPGNFMHLGLISMLFPEARVIHCVREPMDNCLSCHFQDLLRSHDYAYDLHSLGRYYRSYEQLMRHWRSVIRLPMMEVQYENLVENQEAVSREMIAFCGLDWDERCLRFYEGGRLANTASYDQVRKPIYKSSLARWKHYEAHLGPLKEGLGL